MLAPRVWVVVTSLSPSSAGQALGLTHRPSFSTARHGTTTERKITTEPDQIRKATTADSSARHTIALVPDGFLEPGPVGVSSQQLTIRRVTGGRRLEAARTTSITPTARLRTVGLIFRCG